MPLTPSWSDFGTSKTWPPSMESIFNVTSKAIILLYCTTEGTQTRDAFNYAFNRDESSNLLRFR